jgi:hypothetical protein
MPGMENWGRMYTNFMDMARGTPMPFQISRDLNEAFSKGMGYYQRAYDAWMRGMAGIAREAYDISRKVVAGETVDAAKFMDAMRSLYTGVSSTVLESLKDTPFEGVKNVEAATKELLAAMPADQARTKEFIEKLLNLNIKAMNASIAAVKQANKSCAEMLEKGEVKGNGYDAFKDSYGKLIEDTVESMSFGHAGSPAARGIADDVAAWAKASMDMATGWSQMTFRLYDGISKSAAKLGTHTHLMDVKLDSPDQLYSFWMNVSREVTATLMDNTAYFENLSSFVRSYTDWVKAGNKLYHDVVTPPSVSQDDLQKLKEELRKMKRSADKQRASAKPKVSSSAAAPENAEHGAS